jgi:hypothetical protein
MAFLIACGQGNSMKNAEQTNKLTIPDKVLRIDTFSTFPPEIDGCSCYFANNLTEFKNGEYIYINDFAEVSFLKVNGVLTKFTQTDYKNVDKTTTMARAKSELYEITIEVKEGKPSGEETWLKSGTIKLSDKNGKSVTKRFYGECGC